MSATTNATASAARAAAAASTATAQDIDLAAQVLDAGGLVAFPTETVYGLGADASSSEAVAGIYAAKGRPSNHPVIVHVAPDADLSFWAAEVPDEARMLIAAFWPGPIDIDSQTICSHARQRKRWPGQCGLALPVSPRCSGVTACIRRAAWWACGCSRPLGQSVWPGVANTC